MASGVDSDVTLRANRDGYSHIQLRPRRLHDATRSTCASDLFGTVYASPIFLCRPAGKNRSSPTANWRRARRQGAHTLQILSTATSTGVEDVNKALGRPVWYQLTRRAPGRPTNKLLRRVEAAGCSVIALTVDNTTAATAKRTSAHVRRI